MDVCADPAIAVPGSPAEQATLAAAANIEAPRIRTCRKSHTPNNVHAENASGFVDGRLLSASASRERGDRLGIRVMSAVSAQSLNDVGRQFGRGLTRSVGIVADVRIGRERHVVRNPDS